MLKAISMVLDSSSKLPPGQLHQAEVLLVLLSVTRRMNVRIHWYQVLLGYFVAVLGDELRTETF